MYSKNMNMGHYPATLNCNFCPACTFSQKIQAKAPNFFENSKFSRDQKRNYALEDFCRSLTKNITCKFFYHYLF